MLSAIITHFSPSSNQTRGKRLNDKAEAIYLGLNSSYLRRLYDVDRSKLMLTAMSYLLFSL